MAFAETFKALSDPVRREILNLLKGGRLTAGEIAGQFDMTAATVSYHLSLLKKSRFDFREPGEEFYLLQPQCLCAGGSLAVVTGLEGEGKNEEQQEGNAADFAGLPAAAVRGRGALPAFAGDHGDTLGLFRQRKRLVIACRHCVRPAAVYFGTASRLLFTPRAVRRRKNRNPVLRTVLLWFCPAVSLLGGAVTLGTGLGYGAPPGTVGPGFEGNSFFWCW